MLSQKSFQLLVWTVWAADWLFFSATDYSLINPLEYCLDYRPFFTIHDPEFKEYTTRCGDPPPVLLGVTNPFFAKALQHWPHIIRIGEMHGASKNLRHSLGLRLCFRSISNFHLYSFSYRDFSCFHFESDRKLIFYFMLYFFNCYFVYPVVVLSVLYSFKVAIYISSVFVLFLYTTTEIIKQLVVVKKWILGNSHLSKDSTQTFKPWKRHRKSFFG